MKHIAEAIVVSAIILGCFFYCSRLPEKTVRVVGYASGEYESDILRWGLSIGTTIHSSDLATGYQILNKDIQKFRDFLHKKGFDTKKFDIRPAYSYQNYNRDGIAVGYVFDQMICFTTDDTTRFAEVETLATDLTELLATGINFRNSSLEYFISALPDVKKQIIGEATKDARERALQVAESSKSKLGKLKYGRVGVFQITEPLSTEVQSYGIYNTNTRKKQISVTLTGEFSLKN